MSFNEKTIKRLNQLVNLLEPDAVTNEDFKKQAKMVVSYVKDMERQLLDTVRNMEKAYGKRHEDLSGKHDMSLTEVKSTIAKETANLKEVFKKLESAVNKRLEEVRDGIDADEDSVAEKVLSRFEIPKIEDLAKSLPVLGTDVRNALEVLQGDERLDYTAIKGLEDKLKELESLTKNRGTVVAGGARNAVQYVDLTDQCDGVKKTFAVPSFRKAVALMGTQFPIIYRPLVDYTLGNKSITLTDEVAAPESTQTLTFLYIK